MAVKNRTIHELIVSLEQERKMAVYDSKDGTMTPKMREYAKGKAFGLDIAMRQLMKAANILDLRP